MYYVTSATASGNPYSFAYLAPPGGLGVCSTENGCTQNDEASIGRALGTGNPESVTLSFLAPSSRDPSLVIPRRAWLRDGQHGFEAFGSGGASVLVNGQRFVVGNDGWITLRSLDDVPSLAFAYDNQEFFVQELVVMPAPAALPLFACAIAGLGWAARRRRSA
jgi:hypothetical protein